MIYYQDTQHNSDETIESKEVHEEASRIQKEAADTQDSSDSSTKPSPTSKPESLIILAHLTYLLQALGLLFGITAIIAGILVFLKRKDVKESWLASHYAWQWRTFLIGLSLFILGFFLAIIVIGVFIWWAGAIYVIYRVIKGWLRLFDHQGIELGWI